MIDKKKKTAILITIIIFCTSGLGFLLWEIFKDRTAPTILIVTPSTDVYNNQEHQLVIDASDSSQIERIWYNWNGTNITYTSPISITFVEGLNTVEAWAQDKSGNIGSTSVSFSVSNNNFTSVWNTSITDNSLNINTTIELPLTESDGPYLFKVDWGDGTNNLITESNSLEKCHTYATEGVYTVNITGIINGWRFNNLRDSIKIIEIKNWGDLNLGNQGGYFKGCENLNITAVDLLDLSQTTNLQATFGDCKNISKIPNINDWNVSSVTDMSYMFRNADNFNQDLGGWHVSCVTDMSYMFSDADSFNQSIGGWDVSGVRDMSYMFGDADSFNQYIGDWDVSGVTDMSYMFHGAHLFNQSIGGWDVSAVTNMNSMFYYADSFNQYIGVWNVSSVADMSFMFYHADSFNQDIGDWNVSDVEDMSYMFRDADSFNQDIGDWNVSNVADMKCMFLFAEDFNQYIGDWDVSGVTDMNSMFQGAYFFNQSIGNWDVSGVTDMNSMFQGAYFFNQSIGNWDVSTVTNMNSMFKYANSFNQDIGDWNVSGVTDMNSMFYNALNFDSDIWEWDVSSVTDFGEIFAGVTLSTSVYDSLLIGWSQLDLQSDLSFNAGNSQYSSGTAAAARNNIINDFDWTISDGGQVS